MQINIHFGKSVIVTPGELRIVVLCALCCQLRTAFNIISKMAILPTVIAFKANIFKFIMNIGISIVWMAKGIIRSGKSLSLNVCFFFLCLPIGFFFLVLTGFGSWGPLFKSSEIIQIESTFLNCSKLIFFIFNYIKCNVTLNNTMLSTCKAQSSWVQNVQTQNTN